MQCVSCPACGDSGVVCENHPGRAWGPLCCLEDPPVWVVKCVCCNPEPLCSHGSCHCGGAGAPCPACCSPVVVTEG